MIEKNQRKFLKAVDNYLLPFMESKGFKRLPPIWKDQPDIDFIREGPRKKDLFDIQLYSHGGAMFKIHIADASYSDVAKFRGEIVPVTHVFQTRLHEPIPMQPVRQSTARVYPSPRWLVATNIFPLSWFHADVSCEQNVLKIIDKIKRLFPQLEAWWASPASHRNWGSHLKNNSYVFDSTTYKFLKSLNRIVGRKKKETNTQ